MKVRRSREVAARIDDVWRIAADPHRLPLWWPQTQRVESVSRAGWTSVFTTPRGRTVRADYSLATTEPPTLARWRQDVEGTPFERIFKAVAYELRLAPAGEGTQVELEVDQQPAGWARFGRLQLRRAAGRQLATALSALAEAVE